MTYEEHIFSGIYFSTSLVAFVMNLLVVASNISYLFKLPPSPLIAFTICGADLINSTINSVLNLIKLVGHSNEGTVCTLDATLLIFGCGMTLGLCLCLTLFRYFSIVGRTKVSKTLAKRLILACFLVSTTVPSLPFIFEGRWNPESYILEPSETYCMLDWASTRTTTRWLIAVVLIWIGTPILVIGWAYHCIYSKFQVSVDGLHENFEESDSHHSDPNASSQHLSNSKKCKTESSTNVPNNPEKRCVFVKVATGNTEEEQRNLLYQSFTIPGIFIIGWTPYLIMIIYEISTNTLASPLIDFLCVYCIVFNQLANPVLVLYFNRIISDNTKRFLTCYERKVEMWNGRIQE